MPFQFGIIFAGEFFALIEERSQSPRLEIFQLIGASFVLILCDFFQQPHSSLRITGFGCLSLVSRGFFIRVICFSFLVACLILNCFANCRKTKTDKMKNQCSIMIQISIQYFSASSMFELVWSSGCLYRIKKSSVFTTSFRMFRRKVPKTSEGLFMSINDICSE